MASAWSSFTYILLPPAILLLLLLLLPVPQRFSGAVVRFVDSALHFSVGQIHVFSIGTFITLVAFVAQTISLRHKYERIQITKQISRPDPLVDLQAKANRWRVERNWWISATTFVVYAMLHRYQAMKKKLLIYSTESLDNN